MIVLPENYYKNDTVHKLVGTPNHYESISCGFLYKTSSKEDNINSIFEHYGGLLLLDGSGTHINHKGKVFPLQPGCFIQRIPGKLHHTYADPDGKWLEFFICLDKDTFSKMVRLGMATDQEDVLYPGVSYGLLESFNTLLRKFKASSEKDLPFLLLECQSILYQLFTLHQDNLNPHHQLKEEMYDLLKNAITERISIQDICKKRNIGYESFRKNFKRYTGISPNQYLMQERINLAKSLLLNNTYSIKEIAAQLGYSDPFVFSKQFKMLTGLSPQKFREIH